MARVLKPGPGSMRGLEWLARAGPAPLDPWRYAMGWSEVAARHHARRLEREGWLERSPMVRGDGSIFCATRTGVRVLGLDLPAAVAPAPTWWAHHSASAWTAAWLTVRGRSFIGPRELLVDERWSAPVRWLDSHSAKRSGHRPDLVAWVSPERPIAIEVELAPKSQSRLRAILRLHRSWIATGRTRVVMYICGDESGRERITWTAAKVGLFETEKHLRVELLETIVDQATDGYEQHRRQSQPVAPA